MPAGFFAAVLDENSGEHKCSDQRFTAGVEVDSRWDTTTLARPRHKLLHRSLAQHRVTARSPAIHRRRATDWSVMLRLHWLVGS